MCNIGSYSISTVKITGNNRSHAAAARFIPAGLSTGVGKLWTAVRSLSNLIKKDDKVQQNFQLNRIQPYTAPREK